MRYLILGNGAAGLAAVEAIGRRDPSGEITIISAEARPAYYRPLIPYILTGEKQDKDLMREPPAGVRVIQGKQATALRPREKEVELEDGERLPYDRLLLAMGARPILPPISHLEGEGAFTLRTWEDALALAQAVPAAHRAVVIGGGRIGTKVALALRRRSLGTAIVEQLPRIVPAQFDEAASAIFCQRLQQEGVELHLGLRVKEVRRDRRKLRGVLLANREALEADLVVVAVGVRPNLELAQRAGVDVGLGVRVDRRLQTNLPRVYAAGDMTETTDLVTGEAIVSATWTQAVAMGQAAGENMAGGKREYPGGLALYNAMELAGWPAISVGVVHPEGPGYEVVAHRQGDNYRKLVFRGNRLVGAMLVGEVDRGGVLATLIREGRDVTALKEGMKGVGLSYASFLSLPLVEADRYAG